MKCPDCSKALKKHAHKCSCGWGGYTEIGPAPTLNALKDEMQRRIEKTDLFHSPQFFINLFDPPGPEDAPQVVSGKDGERYWKWPYQVRILYLLGKFIKHKKAFQDFIIEAGKNGIHWRGDDPAFFYMIVSENDKMRKVGVDQYRKDARMKLKAFR